MNKHLWSLAVALALVGGCTSTTAPVTQTVAEIPAMSFSPQWKAQLPLDGRKLESMYLRDDLIILYTTNHVAYGVNRASGVLAFITDVTRTPVTLFAPTTIADKVYYPSNTNFSVYDKKGKLIDTLELGFPLSSGAVSDGPMLFFGGDRGTGRLFCLDTRQSFAAGHAIPRWELATDSSAAVVSQPATYQGLIYVAFQDGKVYAVNADNRNGVWPIKDFQSATGLAGYFRCDGEVDADLRADGAGVYVASRDTKLYCLNRTTGLVKWIYFASEPLDQACEVTNTTAYIHVNGKGLVAIDKNNGKFHRDPKWVMADATRFLAEDDKFAFLLRGKNTIVAVDKQTGEPKFTSKRKDLAFFGTNTKDGVVYAANERGELFGIVAVTKPGTMGEVVWNQTPIAGPLAAAGN